METVIRRRWAMPSGDTFDIAPIGELVNRFLHGSKTSIDPFARNKRWATYTNDLNPDTSAEWHMDALDFLKMLAGMNVQADLVLFDPPYSFEQMMRTYEGIGRKISGRESQRFYGDVRDAIDRLVIPGGIVVSFGWNSIGMGKGRHYKIQEILMVCHGRAHNDTIVTVEQKVAKQAAMFAEAASLQDGSTQ